MNLFVYIRLMNLKNNMYALVRNKCEGLHVLSDNLRVRDHTKLVLVQANKLTKHKS